MRDSFIFYRSFFEATKPLTKEQKAELFDAICEFALNDKKIPISNFPSAMFSLIMPQLEANRVRRENGKRGGRPQNTQNKITEAKPNDNQTITKTKANVNVNVNVNDNDIINNIENKTKTEEKQKPSIKQIINEQSITGKLPAEFQPYIESFIDYWSETDKKGNEKRTKEKTRDLLLRLKTRKRNAETQFGRKQVVSVDYEKLEQFDKQMSIDVEPIKARFSKKYGPGRETYYSKTKQEWKHSDLYLKG